MTEREPVEVEVRYCRSDGVMEDVPLESLAVEDVSSGRPVREFRSYRGRRHYSGWYWSSTMRGQVVYESRLELARLLLADQTRDVVKIAAQPMCLRGQDGHRIRTPVPDLLLVHDDARVTLVDVKPADQLEEPAVLDVQALLRSRGLPFDVREVSALVQWGVTDFGPPSEPRRGGAGGWGHAGFARIVVATTRRTARRTPSRCFAVK